MIVLKDAVICHIHNHIVDLATDVILDIHEYNIGNLDINEFLSQLESKMNRIIIDTNIATEKGQHMENRLSLYKETIESLGFERKK